MSRREREGAAAIVAGDDGVREAHGMVRRWDAEEGFGVIDSPLTPGGCGTVFSAIQMDGNPTLTAGQRVRFQFVAAYQDGYRFRAVAVFPEG
jgi:CspA family cold shock protein